MESPSDTTPSGVLANRTAVITGGSSGIGRSIALLFGMCGARVIILDIGSAEDTVGLIEAGGGTASHIACDVTKQRAVIAAFESIGDVDILVNSAGVGFVGTLEQTSEADYDRVMGMNAKGTYNCLLAAIRGMKERGGVILNIASVAGNLGIPDRFAYSASKGAVISMTQSVARDYVAHGVRCNSVSPGRVHTPLVDTFLAKAYPGKEAEMFDVLSKTQPMGRMGRPDEIAELALFLCSDASSFITGSNFPIDGGFTNLKM